MTGVGKEINDDPLFPVGARLIDGINWAEERSEFNVAFKKNTVPVRKPVYRKRNIKRARRFVFRKRR